MKVLDVLCVLGSARKKPINPLAPLRFTNIGTTEAIVGFTGSVPALLYKTQYDSDFQIWYGETILSPNEYVEIIGYKIATAPFTNENRHFSTSGDISVSGNIMSLVYGKSLDEENQYILTFSNTFSYLFQKCSIIDASQLILPATKLISFCYSNMFLYCEKLTKTPKLPATILDDNCYSFIFGYCTNLIIAPELPATTLASYCYNSMFRNCTNLIIAPKLPAIILASGCYYHMFENASNLGKIEVSFLEWDRSNIWWLYGVSPTGTFICPKELPEERGDDYIPNNWTIERF